MDQFVALTTPRRTAALLTILLCLLACAPLDAQKVIQLEKRGAVKTKKYYVGDEMLIRLQDEDFWRRGYIIDIDVEADLVNYSFGDVHIDEIATVRKRNYKEVNKKWQNSAIYGALGTLPFIVADQVASEDPNTGLAAVLFAAPLAGFAVTPINSLLSKKKIGGRRRLRLLDLTYAAPLQP